jgi:hypothetical protein
MVDDVLDEQRRARLGLIGYRVAAAAKAGMCIVMPVSRTPPPK